jgi:hypothetical protein
VSFCIICCLVVIWFVSFAISDVLNTRFTFFNCLFYDCFLVSCVLFSIFYVLCFCIVSSHVYSCLYTICVQAYEKLSTGGNSIAINKYHIIP